MNGWEEANTGGGEDVASLGAHHIYVTDKSPGHCNSESLVMSS